jgi:two-component system sensor histidine kinase EvgS
VTASPGSDIPSLLDEEILANLHEDFASTGDLDELAALIRKFLERGAESVAAVADAVERGDAEGTRASAHKLKGSSRTLGASLVGAVSAQVEHAGAAGDLVAAARGLRELEIAFSRTRVALTERFAT